MHRLVAASVMAAGLLSSLCLPSRAAPFNPDIEPDWIKWTQLTKALGPSPSVRGHRFGVVLKTQTNEYWRLMAAGYRRRAAAGGAKVDIQAAQSETDQLRQLSILHTMIGSGYKALMISPISAVNLKSALEEVKAARIPIVNVDGAVADEVRHFVGPVNRDMGVEVAKWFIRHYPAGGKVAVIEGQAGVLSTVHRTAGFIETLLATGKFEVAATPSGQWDRQIASDAAKAVVTRTPDLIGFYCNNDTMALGVVDALKSLQALDRVRVFGSDGTAVAYASIRAGELTGTVDIFPMMVGEIGLEIAERLSAGQSVPRVVETPQVLVTRENIARYGADEEARRRALIEDAREK
ncbi:substrate-binding domain-containing protein [Methylobacterium iners]|uniref:Periplasmic binding protein domain-containing protein n=1 Tax=Methylobacterium iners TaxID=418707 RepID=A0ABQ4S0X3_9HYPH|nr:substrate-binding domain-containing protein [Methylobacterium iners]GJD95493.1 hypothetical protein OCOJLMKI_2706 [Methylobacterium iners]